jgi:hypothetical protein
MFPATCNLLNLHFPNILLRRFEESLGTWLAVNTKLTEVVSTPYKDVGVITGAGQRRYHKTHLALIRYKRSFCFCLIILLLVHHTVFA